MQEHRQEAEEALEALGHEIHWDVLGAKIAHGRCIDCGASVVIESSRGPFFARKGSAFRERCKGAQFTSRRAGAT